MASNAKTTSSLIMGGVREDSDRLERVPAAEVPAGTAAGEPSRRFTVFAGGALVALLVPLFVSLGLWQWNKAEVKMARQALLDRRAAEPPVALTSSPADAESLRYRRVTVRGVYEPARQILVDNRVHRQRAGYHVLTPLRIEGGDMRVLVNRGWLPAAAEHHRVPSVVTPADVVELEATAIVPGSRFFTLAAEPVSDGWQAVWQNLDLDRYREQAAFPLQPLVLLLDPDSTAGGFVREWPRPDERIERHIGYAWQWFGFAVAAVGIWLFFLVRPWLQRR